ncbi:MAG: 1,2-phenylacetyl-CoA epoxidase subunit PaaC [Beijerinckiaceae bacterium]
MTDTPLFIYTLRLADNALVLGHRLSEWVSLGPTLEEDIALGNLGLDLIGQARMFYDYAGAIEGKGRDQDALAYFRDGNAYRNVLLVEQPNGDFAFTMMRHFFYAAFAAPFAKALMQSSDATLANIAAKAEKELAYHLRHASEWVIRLGDGTDESHRRAQDAADELITYTGELFETDQAEQALIDKGIAPDPQTLRTLYQNTLQHVFQEATLTLPKIGFSQTGGRQGKHSEHLQHMLDEMQSLARAHPGAVW